MNPPPPASSSSNAGAGAPKSADDLRRNTLNMEKMIKKNIMAASRPGAMKRGQAVVEFFKQQQQKDHNHHTSSSSSNAFDVEPSTAKRSKKDHPAAYTSATPPPQSSSSSSSSAATAVPGASLRTTHSLVGPPATPIVPKPVVANAAAAVMMEATNASILAAAHRGSPLRSSARASPLRSSVRASPLRQVFTSPSRRVVAPRLPEITTTVAGSGGMAPMHTPVLNLDQVDGASSASTTNALKPPTLPSKSPFQSFQSKLGQSRGTGVVKTPSPARPSPSLSLQSRRAASPAPQLESRTYPATHTGSTTMTVAAMAAVTTPPSSSQHIVDLTEEKTPVPTVKPPAPSSSMIILTTPPTKPLARSLFSSAASSSSSVSTKSLCFSTEGVASSLDVSPDGECIVAAFSDGSVRLFEMDSTVPSDRHGYLLGHLDEESNQSSAGAHLRVKITSDGRFAFVGCRSGPRVMMSIHLHNYRHGKDTEDDDVDQLQKSFHSNARLRGFSDATPCPLPATATAGDMSPSSSPRSYYLLCGLGVGTLNMWQFMESPPRSTSTSESPWRHLYSIPTNGNTAVIASFLPPFQNDDATTTNGSLLRLAGKCEDKNIRVWNLEIPPARATAASDSMDQEEADIDGGAVHMVQGHYDVPSSKDVVAFYGSYAYGIAPTGEACRFQIPTTGVAMVRTFFEMERFDMGSSSKSRRSNVILESIYASDDAKTVVAVSAEGIFYYTNDAPSDPNSTGCILRIIGRNSSLNTQFKSPMKVYKPIRPSTTAATATGGVVMEEAVMAVVTNPQSDENGEEGYVNVDPTEMWAARWMKPSLGQNCWVCGVRNIRHWQSDPQLVRKTVAAAAPQVLAPPSATKVSPVARAAAKTTVKNSSSSSSSSSSSAVAPKGDLLSSSTPESPVASHTAKPKPDRPIKPAQEHKKHKAKAALAPSATAAATPSAVKRLEVESPEDAKANANAKTAAAAARSMEQELRAQQQQLVSELARYKERYNQIVTEWQRRLKGEKQMRRLWKQRESEFEAQLHETLLKLDAAETQVSELQNAHKNAEKKFIFEKLKAEQQTSVKVKYDQLCLQMQDKMAAMEHQQRLLEQTTKALLQEVDRHVHHTKQSVNGLVDGTQSQQNECILCKDKHAVTAIVPCGHLCFCEEDAEVYRRNFRGNGDITCPICQREMISMLRIY